MSADDCYIQWLPDHLIAYMFDRVGAFRCDVDSVVSRALCVRSMALTCRRYAALLGDATAKTVRRQLETHIETNASSATMRDCDPRSGSTHWMCVDPSLRYTAIVRRNYNERLMIQFLQFFGDDDATLVWQRNLVQRILAGGWHRVATAPFQPVLGGGRRQLRTYYSRHTASSMLIVDDDDATYATASTDTCEMARNHYDRAVGAMCDAATMASLEFVAPVSLVARLRSARRMASSSGGGGGAIVIANYCSAGGE